jgi:hypothetical protein
MTQAGRTLATLLLAGGLTTPVLGQPAHPGDMDRATTLQGFLGAVSDATASAPVFGGAAGWSLTPRLALEAAGEWFVYRQDREAFGASLVLRTRLVSWGRSHLFIREGIGLYRVSFAAGCAVVGSGGCNDATIPAFYRRRWNPDLNGLEGRAFTDPSLIVGAGVDVPVTRRLAVRPALDARIVLRNRRAAVVTSFAVAAVVQFEHHPVTPSRRR